MKIAQRHFLGEKAFKGAPIRFIVIYGSIISPIVAVVALIDIVMRWVS